MNESSRKRRFQIHLSTAVVMMIAAGALIWANVKPRLEKGETIEQFEQQGGHIIFSELDGAISEIFSADTLLQAEEKQFKFGWPACVYRREFGILTYSDKPAKEVDLDKRMWWSSIGINLLVALGALLLVWFLCEWLIRRRAARNDLAVQPPV